MWADKWPVRYTNWGKGEPDRLANEGCVSHTVDGSWQDVPCQMQLGFACEINLSKSINLYHTTKQPKLFPAFFFFSLENCQFSITNQIKETSQ